VALIKLMGLNLKMRVRERQISGKQKGEENNEEEDEGRWLKI